jgi:hypothetical protein
VRSDVDGFWSYDNPRSEADCCLQIEQLRKVTMQPTFTQNSVLRIPTFVSGEHATEWGSHLNAEQYIELVKAQRALRYTAAAESNLKLKVDLATQSKLMCEAAGAFALI